MELRDTRKPRCQGIMAGINAALKVKNEAPLVLDRTEAYTAFLIDDLISKGTERTLPDVHLARRVRLHLRHSTTPIVA